MTTRIGINGFGRIGRTFLRAALKNNADVEVVAVNDLANSTTLGTLLEWDSLAGHLEGVAIEPDALAVAGHRIAVLGERDPAAIRWGDLGVDVVIESTGRFTDRASASAHLRGGAKKVIISAPAKGDVPTFVLGVNDDTLDPSTDDVFSNGSCTTNSLAPLAAVLHERFGIESGLMTTVHAYTSDQRLHDAPHSDLRRARAAAVSTIPAALRVPVPVGSITDLTVLLERPADVAAVNTAFREASQSPRLQHYLQYSEAPLVSADIVGNPYSTIFDAPLTMAVGRQVKVHGWYDNEWGFSNRLVEFAERIGAGL